MKVQMIDSHCHLYVKAFESDRDAMVQRALDAGVERLFLPAIDKDEHENMLKLEARWPEHCRAMMGLHPCSVMEDLEEELALVRQWLDKRPFAAIGEIGLDYYWDLSFKEQQQAALRKQLEWSVEFSLPVVIHSRNSVQDCISIVKEFHGQLKPGIFHCFSDDLNTAQQILEEGFYVGIGGTITYKNSQLPAVVRELPLERIVLETDAPYLTPVPFRGKRNESSYLTYVAEAIAKAQDKSLEEVARVTTANAQKIFGN
jgi:TatD DNase family protein